MGHGACQMQLGVPDSLYTHALYAQLWTVPLHVGCRKICHDPHPPTLHPLLPSSLKYVGILCEIKSSDPCTEILDNDLCILPLIHIWQQLYKVRYWSED